MKISARTTVGTLADADVLPLSASDGAGGFLDRAMLGASVFAAFRARMTVNAQTGTTYTLVLADAGKLVTLDNAGAITLTVPTNASVAFPVGSEVNCAQIGAGLVTISGDTGVTINGTTPGSKASAGQWSRWRLVKLATDTWLATGELA